jgi:enamine deaminase RidA (YjgF/YER057c/UK114 family)
MLVHSTEHFGAGRPHGSSAGCAVLDLAQVTRFVLMIAPQNRGTFHEQAREVFTIMSAVLEKDKRPGAITLQTVFLRDLRDQAEFEKCFAEHFRSELPVTNFVAQPPCDGAAFAIEVWAIQGDAVKLERHNANTLSVSYDGVRWIYCGGVAMPSAPSLYEQASQSFQRMSDLLGAARSGFPHVLRTWLYLGGIVERDGESLRYQELNRARADYYHGLKFGHGLPIRNGAHSIYPASTGIGTLGSGLVMSCLAIETVRDDLFLLPLENPGQTPAYAYAQQYSIQSPKFSRAMALGLGHYITTWVSGTASIVDSESRFTGDVEGQTEQTIDNIERLIAPENFATHGLKGAGATLRDLMKIRVYLKRPEDLEKCRATCARRFGSVPALFLVGDICRPELLVEIEGVAFSKCDFLNSGVGI